MKNKELVFGDINLTAEEEEYFELQEQVSHLLIEIIGRRIDLKMSQRDLAQKCGIKQPMIARIERMDAIPRIDTLIKICNALDLKIEIKPNNKGKDNIIATESISYNGKAYNQRSMQLNETVDKLEKAHTSKKSVKK